VTILKVRVITLDTKENPVEDKTFPEFNSDDFDVYITECYRKLENGEIYGIKITQVFDWVENHIQPEKANLCILA
jgi:hypothetical protein